MIDKETAEALAWLFSTGKRRDSDGARSAATACPARVPNSTAKRGPQGIAKPSGGGIAND